MAAVRRPRYYALGLSGLDKMNEVWGNLTVIGAILVPVAIVSAAWLKSGDFRRRRKIYRLRAELQETCPHVSLFDEDGNLFPTELYYPLDNGLLECNFCSSKLSEREAKATLRYWHDASEERQQELLRADRKADELRKKLDPLGNWTKE